MDCSIRALMLTAVSMFAAAQIALAADPSAPQKPSYLITEPLDPNDRVARARLTFFFYSIVNEREEMESGAGARFLRGQFKLDEQTAREYMSYIQGVLVQQQAFSKDQIGSQCANRANISSRQDLARTMSDTDRRFHLHAAQIAEESILILGQDRKSAVDAYIARHYKGTTVTRTDYLNKMEALGLSAEDVLQEMCD